MLAAATQLVHIIFLLSSRASGTTTISDVFFAGLAAVTFCTATPEQYVFELPKAMQRKASQVCTGLLRLLRASSCVGKRALQVVALHVSRAGLGPGEATACLCEYTQLEWTIKFAR